MQEGRKHPQEQGRRLAMTKVAVIGRDSIAFLIRLAKAMGSRGIHAAVTDWSKGGDWRQSLPLPSQQGERTGGPVDVAGVDVFAPGTGKGKTEAALMFDYYGMSAPQKGYGKCLILASQSPAELGSLSKIGREGQAVAVVGNSAGGSIGRKYIHTVLHLGKDDLLLPIPFDGKDARLNMQYEITGRLYGRKLSGGYTDALFQAMCFLLDAQPLTRKEEKEVLRALW